MATDISYKSKKLEKICTDYSVAKRFYGEGIAVKIHQRMGEIRAIASVELLLRFSIGRCHQLKGNRSSEYAMDLVHPFRLVFDITGHGIQLVRILSIEDYH